MVGALDYRSPQGCDSSRLSVKAATIIQELDMRPLTERILARRDILRA